MSERLPDDELAVCQGLVMAACGHPNYNENVDAGLSGWREETARLRASETEKAAEIERLKAELARLTPSGQVAEDGAALLEVLKRRAYGDDCAPSQERVRRLAAKAQGHEAVKAANDAMREPMRKLRDAVGMPAEGESTVVDALLKERQEREETIKALSEALSDTAPTVSNKGSPCWCPAVRSQGSREPEPADTAHDAYCRPKRAALRLAGVLP